MRLRDIVAPCDGAVGPQQQGTARWGARRRACLPHLSRPVSLGVAVLAAAAWLGGQVASAPAQNYVYTPPPAYAPAPPVVSSVATPRLADAQIDQLTGPIALYPDALVAQILPASSYPLEVVAAAQWLQANSTPPEAAIDAQPWEPSVKAIAHYPTVVQMMSSSVGWMQALGSAFVNQPADVMNSIQRLRSQAQAAGTLVSTPQQQVLVVDGAIRIVPVDPALIYVPAYDPAVVYVRHGGPVYNAITFGLGFAIGGWLDKDTDWHRHWIADGVRWDPHEHRQIIVHPGPARVEAGHPWSRDPARPPVAAVGHPAFDEHRGFAAPAPRPAPGGFRAEEPRQDVEHAEQRGHESMRGGHEEHH